MPHRKWGQVRDGGYSWRMSPLREPILSEPSLSESVLSEPSLSDGMDEEGPAAACATEEAAEGSVALGWSSATFSRNVADGAKNRFPVTARLKSRRRS